MTSPNGAHRRILTVVLAAAAVVMCVRGEVPAQRAGPIGPGLHVRSLEWSGSTRRYLVYVPRSLSGERRAPVVLNFHGGSSRAEDQVALSQMNPAADKAGFVVIYPEGIGRLRRHTFNAGTCCGLARRREVDDVGFAFAVLDDVARSAPIATSQVYATGMSNGAMMAYRLACERADRVAAIAPVGGVLVFQPCTPARPMPVMHFHGTADRYVPFEGSRRLGYPSVPDTAEFWRQRDRCVEGEGRVTYKQGGAECRTYGPCEAGSDVTLCTIKDGGHTWPGGRPFPRGGVTSRDIDASARMLAFFGEHAMQ